VDASLEIMVLSSYEILMLTTLLIPALTAVWIIFLQKDLSEKITKFNQILKEYERQEAKKLLRKIKEIISKKSEKSTDEALEALTKYFDDWKIKSAAISLLIKKEERIYQLGKIMLAMLLVIYLSGIYTSWGPNDYFLGTNYSRLSVLQSFFIILIFIVVLWLWDILNFGKELNKVCYGSSYDIEELISKYIEEIRRNR